MLTDAQRASVASMAKEWGIDPQELLKEAEAMAAEAEGEGPESKEDKPDDEEKPEPDKKAGSDINGGRGFFAYQYPFLKVNEVRASVGMPPIGDGDLFTQEWLPKHGGGGASPSKATDGGDGGEA
jgi:hypothetical protein